MLFFVNRCSFLIELMFRLNYFANVLIKGTLAIQFKDILDVMQYQGYLLRMLCIVSVFINERK